MNANIILKKYKPYLARQWSHTASILGLYVALITIPIQLLKSPLMSWEPKMQYVEAGDTIR